MSEKTAATPMDTEMITRGIRATEIGLAALERVFRRDIDRIRDQLNELHRSIKLGEPTEFVRRFGVARQIEYAAKAHPLAHELASDVLYTDYYQHALELSVWPLLCMAAGIEGDGLASHVRLWCHAGSIELDEAVERKMFEAADVRYTPTKAIRCTRDVHADEADTTHSSRVNHA